MSDDLSGLVISLVVAVMLLTIAALIRVRGPMGFVKNIDWNRVSDPHGLGQFVSLVLVLMGALIAAHGVVLYAFRADHALRNACSVVFVILICLATIALLIGQQRYQDKLTTRRSDERR